jgi:signal transduction histidine kinase
VVVFAELWRRGQLIIEQRAALSQQVADIERLNAQLERSNAVLEGFAARAAEDLLEPLDAIAGFLELLVDRPGGLGENGGLLASRATALANRQRERVAALLEYADVSSVSVDLEPVDLSTAIEEACARAGLSLGGATVQIAGGAHPVVTGDQRQLVRLLEVLIDRAVRSANASTVTFSVEPEGGGVHVRVADDGKLISPEDAAAMFDARLDARLEDPDSVGLVVSRRIVERHGGTIWAEPGETGAGTVVTFTLPVHQAA